MKTIRRQNARHDVRTGATLTEVLMSLLIMSIGVSTVALMFPISMRRTLVASQQTNSTIARFNAEALADVDPNFIHNPDGNFPPGAAIDTTPYNGSTFRGHSYLVDPLGYQEFNYDPVTPTNPLPGSPVIAPFPVGNSPRDFFGNNVPAFVNWPLPRRYTGATLFANPYCSLPGPPTAVQQLLIARTRATALVTQPDNWKVATEAQSVTPAGTGITSVTLDTEGDLSSVVVIDPATSLPTGISYRAVIYDIDGTHSETRMLIANPVGQTISWTDPLPSQFEVSPTTGATPNLGRIRVEQSDQVYTWMLSVRKRPSGSCNVDVVVFFKRNFDPNQERVFDAEFRKWKWINGANDYAGTLAQRAPGIAGVDDNGNGVVDEVSEFGYPLPGASAAESELPNAVVTLKVSSATPEEDRPKPQKGNYIYDTKNGLWYRIRAVQNEQYGVAGASGPEDWMDVVLDETIKLDSTEDLDGDGTLNLPGEDRNGDGAVTRGGAILHHSVVNVFPLEIKEP